MCARAAAEGVEDDEEEDVAREEEGWVAREAEGNEESGRGGSGALVVTVAESWGLRGAERVRAALAGKERELFILRMRCSCSSRAMSASVSASTSSGAALSSASGNAFPPMYVRLLVNVGSMIRKNTPFPQEVAQQQR